MEQEKRTSILLAERIIADLFNTENKLVAKLSETDIEKIYNYLVDVFDKFDICNKNTLSETYTAGSKLGYIEGFKCAISALNASLEGIEKQFKS